MLTPSLSQNPPATRSDRPEDHSAELVSHARDLERGGELEAAAQVYSQVLTLLPEGEGDSAIQVANRRLAALEGRGGFQLETLEVFAGQFLNQALDPAMIFSFLVAGNVGAGTARGISALLQGRARSAFLQRGMGNLLAQNLGSLAAEVPAFVGTHRLLQGQPARTWGEDLASAGIFLGTLKAFHLATPLLAQSLSPNFRYPRALAHGGSLAGIFTAQGLEEAAGLTPHREFTDRFRDTFATFFQLQVAGKILSPIQRSSLLPQNIPSLPRLSLPGDFSRLQSSR
ncbi:MAG: hypothetical protein R3257_03290, partial [bacterium]|nr:hypothetical protein [bacterium]